MNTKTHIGTSGWSDKRCLGPFYPEKMRACEMARTLRAVLRDLTKRKSAIIDYKWT